MLLRFTEVKLSADPLCLRVDFLFVEYGVFLLPVFFGVDHAWVEIFWLHAPVLAECHCIFIHILNVVAVNHLIFGASVEVQLILLLTLGVLESVVVDGHFTPVSLPVLLLQIVQLASLVVEEESLFVEQTLHVIVLLGMFVS